MAQNNSDSVLCSSVKPLRILSNNTFVVYKKKYEGCLRLDVINNNWLSDQLDASTISQRFFYKNKLNI